MSKTNEKKEQSMVYKKAKEFVEILDSIDYISYIAGEYSKLMDYVNSIEYTIDRKAAKNNQLPEDLTKGILADNAMKSLEEVRNQIDEVYIIVERISKN